MNASLLLLLLLSLLPSAPGPSSPAPPEANLPPLAAQALQALEEGDSPRALRLSLALLPEGCPQAQLAAAILLELAPHLVLCQAPQLWAHAQETGACDQALAALLQLHRLDSPRCPGASAALAGLEVPDQWRLSSSASPSPLLRALTQPPAPPAGLSQRAPHWAVRGRSFVQAETSVCLAQGQELLWFWEGGAPGALWVDDRQLLLREPGTLLLAPQHARLALAPGCHRVVLTLAPDPGQGQAFLAYLPVRTPTPREGVAPARPNPDRPNPDRQGGGALGRPNPDRQGGGALGRPNPDRQGGGGALGSAPSPGGPGSLGAPATVLVQLLAGNDLAAREALDACSPEQPGCFAAARSFFTHLGQTRPLVELTQGLLGGESPGACGAQLWMLRRLRGDDQEALRTWLDLWPLGCQANYEARLFLLELELEEDRLETGQAHHQALVEDLALQGPALDCRLEALARRLPGRSLPPSPDPCGFSGAPTAPPPDPATQAPEDLWTLADGALARGEDRQAQKRFQQAASSPVAGEDLRWRATVALGAADLLALARPPGEAISEYRASGFAPAQDAVLVLDEVLMWPGPFGRLQLLETAIWHLRSPEATAQWADLQLPEDAHLLALELQKPDGTRLSPAWAGPGEAISLKGLEADDLVILSLLHDTRPQLELGQDYCLPEHRFVGPGVPVFRSVLGIAGPELPRLRALRYHGAPKGRTGEVASGQGVWWFQAGPLEAAPSGPLELNSQGSLPRVQVCTRGMSLLGLRNALADTVLRLVRPGPTLEAASARLVLQPDPVAAALGEAIQGLEANPDLLLHRSAERMAAEGEGHSALLLLALLQRLGLDARLALVAPPGAEGLAPLAPAPEAFSEALVLLRQGPREIWLDPWSRAARPGLVRPFLEGRPALLLGGAAEALLTRVPRAAPETHRRTLRLTLKVQADGSAQGRARLLFEGLSASGACQNLQGLDGAGQRQALQNYLEALLPQVQVDSGLARCDPGGLEMTGRLTLPKGTLLQPLEVTLPAAALGLQAQDQGLSPGPWLLEGMAHSTLELDLDLPGALAGLQAQVGTGSLDLPFGRVTTKLRQGPNHLHLHQTVFAQESEIAAAQGPTLEAFLEACAAQGHLILLPKESLP